MIFIYIFSLHLALPLFFSFAWLDCTKLCYFDLCVVLLVFFLFPKG
jgi:hypothetical protein